MAAHVAPALFSLFVLCVATSGGPALADSTPIHPSLRDKCSTIVIGKEVTADGATMLAHNEDLGNYSAHRYIYVPHKRHTPGEEVVTYFGARVPQVHETYAYTGTSLFDIAYSPGDVTSGINEHLVAVVNNASYTREAPDPLPTEGRIIWTEFTKFALERARTAREAVAVIGGLASAHQLGGDSGTMFGVIDPNEGWWIEITYDGQWVAQRMPADGATARANIFRIGKVDFKDPENFRYSDDLVSYAEARSWYQSGDFDFAAVYAEPTLIGSAYNLRRTQRIADLLAPAVTTGLVTPQLVMTVLRDHYEGTEYDLTNGHRQGSPHQTDERTLCRLDTEVSTVIQARTKIGRWAVPPEIGGIAWRAMGTPCTSVYSPWYLGSRDIPREYQAGDSQYTEGSAYWTARNLSRLVDMRYKSQVLQPIWGVRDAFEQGVFAMQPKIEATALQLYRWNPELARRYLSEYSSSLARQAQEKLKGMIRTAQSPHQGR